jgi:ankyrin repeat protein
MNHRQSGPLHYAADGYIIGPAWDEERQIKTIECLLGAGADVNAQDKNGATSLHRAVRTRCAAATRALLEAGADPSLKNKAGSSAFHLAVQNTGRGGTGTDEARAAQRQIIEEFLRSGVSPLIKDGKGKTVLDWAKSAWIREMFECM